MVELRDMSFCTSNIFGMQEEHKNIFCQAILFFYLLQEIKDDLEPSTRSHTIPGLLKLFETSSIFLTSGLLWLLYLFLYSLFTTALICAALGILR